MRPLALVRSARGKRPRSVIRRRADTGSRRESDGRPRWHVAVVVENVPMGEDPRLRKQVDDLLAEGYRVTVVTRRDELNSSHRARDGLTLLEYPSPAEPTGPAGYVREYATSFLWAAYLLGRLRVREHIDVLQLCQPPDVYFPLARLLRWAGARIVVDQRDLMPEVLHSKYDHAPRTASQLLHWLERRTQRIADRTVTVNGYLRDRLLRAGGRSSRLTVIWNGPVLARTRAARPNPDLRREGAFLVVWVGKMGRQDRVDLVLRVAARIVHDWGRDDCDFVLIGAGECLEELRAQAAGLGVRHRVRFTGWVPEDTVFEYLATADLGIDTSLQEEVSPVKAMEFMAFGVPFVCFDLGESRRIGEGAAEFAPPGDVHRLAEKVVGLLDRPDRRTALGEVGRRRVEDELAWERQTQAYLEAVGPSDDQALGDADD